MKVVVNRNRTVIVAVKPGSVTSLEPDGFGGHVEQRVRPECKAYGPNSLLDMPDDEARRLIASGHVRKYEEPASPQAA